MSISPTRKELSHARIVDVASKAIRRAGYRGVGVADIMKEAGVQYAFPAGAVELQPGQEWPVDYGALTNAKRAKCGKSDD